MMHSPTTPYPQLTLITGGSRSGKSRHAVGLAQSLGERVVYLATYEGGDSEMAGRVARHRQERPAHWQTIQQSRTLPETIAALDTDTSGIILDCLTMHVSALMLDAGCGDGVEEQLHQLGAACQSAPCPMIIVTNEVGSGVVPPSTMGRAFRDLAGQANQIMASYADQVLLMVAGLPVVVKGTQLAAMEQHDTI